MARLGETDRIVQQLKQAVEGESWTGPALYDLLRRIDATTAAARPLPGANSIWTLVRHLAATNDLVRRRIDGGPHADRVPAELDFPPPPEHPTAEDWRRTVLEFKASELELRDAISGFDESRLDEPLMPGGTTAYNNFHGVVQHILYHTGQIALLRKAVDGGSTSRDQ
ncbi:MAG: DinB family protein [Phycisphaerales bacterium]